MSVLSEMRSRLAVVEASKKIQPCLGSVQVPNIAIQLKNTPSICSSVFLACDAECCRDIPLVALCLLEREIVHHAHEFPAQLSFGEIIRFESYEAKHRPAQSFIYATRPGCQ